MLKKAFLVLSVAVLAVACGKQAETTTTDETTDSVTTVVDNAATQADATVADAPETPEETAAHEEEETKDVAANNGIDEQLDEFEGLITKWVAVAKKFKAGDPTVAPEFQKLSDKVQSLNSKISSEASNMTAAQAKRFAELANKMTSAL